MPVNTLSRRDDNLNLYNLERKGLRLYDTGLAANHTDLAVWRRCV